MRESPGEAFGNATGIGATLSTIGAGYMADHFGTATAFAGLAAIGVLSLALLLLLMPETKPADDELYRPRPPSRRACGTLGQSD